MADIIEIGKRIETARTELQLTQEELAKELGLNKSTIQRYETGKVQKIKLPIIDSMARILKVNPAWLSDKSDERTIQNDKESNIIKDALPYSPQEMIPIPVIGRVAAGYNCLAQTDIECYELVNNENINDGYDYVYLRVKGDSMTPLILENDLVLVRLQSDVNNGDYAVVIVDEEDGLVKKIDRGNDYITLLSENPYYPPRKFERKDMNRVRIFGKVIESKRKF